MSIRIMSLIWDSGLYDGSTLLTLLALADWANDGGVCWPSIPEIARKSRQGERNCQYCITRLLNDGAITRKFRTEQTSIFKINMGKFSSSPGAKTAPVRRESTDAKPAPDGATACAAGVQSTTSGVQSVAPKPSVKATVNEPSNSGKENPALQSSFPTNGNGRPKGLSQDERDTMDFKALRREMDKVESVWAESGGRKMSDEDWANFVRKCAYLAGVTPARAQELMGKFFPNDPGVAMICTNPELPFTSVAP